MPARPHRRELIERVAHALAWNEIASDCVSPPELFAELDEADRFYLCNDAEDLLTALRKAGLVVTVRKRGKRG